MSTDLNIRVISNLKSTEFFTLYQQDINLNAKNFKVGAWETGFISPGAQFYTVLPIALQVQGRIDQNDSVYSTKLMEAEYNPNYEIYMNSEGLDIQASSLTPPTDNTINLYNSKRCYFKRECKIKCVSYKKKLTHFVHYTGCVKIKKTKE